MTANHARVTVSTGTPLDVRTFAVHLEMSQLFRIEIVAVSPDHDVDFDEVIGTAASFSLSGLATTEAWAGLCLEMEQLRVDEAGLATYRLVLVPNAWRLTQRTNYRIFQYKSELDIVQQMLGEWGIAYESRASGGTHKPRKFCVQYGESDFVFVQRMLEDAGISFYFQYSSDDTVLVLDDAPESRDNEFPALLYHDEPGAIDTRFVTDVAVRTRLRPGTMTIGDVDYRRPSTNQPRLTRSQGLPQELALEQFEHEPGAFLYQGAPGGATPFADDRGAARTDEGAGAAKVANRLLGKRIDAKVASFTSDVLGLAPGRVTSVIHHPHRDLSDSQGLLVTRSSIEGVYSEYWRVRVEVVPTSMPYRPAPRTPKPKVYGVESATVVGPTAEEIHTDEYGRVRVHFHWDRESNRDETSSCWLPTNQPWAGQGFGGVNLPRVGQEVLVEFLGGDPDRPVVVGRVHTEANPVPDPLPKYKHVAGIFSESTPRLVMGGAGSAVATPNTGVYGGTPMTPDDMASNATAPGPTQVVSPTGTNHTWHGSGMKLDDMSGAENLYIQANKDMHWVVHNNWTSVVGAHRTAKTGTDDITTVRQGQALLIGSNQDSLVGGNQGNTIWGDRTDSVGDSFQQTLQKTLKVQSLDENLLIQSDDSILFDSDVTIELRVGASLLKVHDAMISVGAQGNKVQLNPSQPTESAEEIAAKEEAKKKAEEATTAKMKQLKADYLKASKADDTWTASDKLNQLDRLAMDRGTTFGDVLNDPSY